jgi:N-acetylmuramoyl-L-alanine amidase
MKKINYLALVLLCMVAVTGCGKKQSEVTEAPTTEEITTETTTMEVTTQATTEEVTEATTEAYNPKEDILIAIDPGHQGPNVDMSATEPNAPGSSEMKAKASTGTVGRYTNVGEYELNLNISKQLRDALTAQGYQVIMTREDNDTAISNAERATMANEAGANVSIRIHANGSDDSSTSGALVLVGSSSNAYVGSLYDDSYRLGKNVLDSYCAATGMANLGVQTNDTMTGINWSQIPVIILEMGFMTNQSDDENMENADYQSKMVSGIVSGINDYFGLDETSAQQDSTDTVLEDLQQSMQDMADTRTAQGDSVSVYVENLNTGAYAEVDSKQLRAASLIKLYVAGCLYEEEQNSSYSISSEDENLIKQMITASDNDATNSLVKKLGDGDAAAGMERVNTFCENHGLTDSHMGRLMLDFSSSQENYTSVRDCAAFLRSVYLGRLAGSEKMLDYLKQQERTSKIPAGVPAGVETANKTGELDNVENDVAIVFAGDNPYVISVMTDNLSDTSAARSWIVQLSGVVYEYMTANDF